ncbi:MAG: glycosyltransferase family 61 protein [Phaeobacter italicus]
MHEQQISAYRVKQAWLIGAQSYLVDRIVPDVERISLPAKDVPGGVLRFGRGAFPPPKARGRLERLRKGAQRSRPVPGPNTLDLRRNTPQNWAHFLNNHLPITFAIAAGMDLALSDLDLVLPEQTPGYIRAAADLFGLRYVQTDDALDGTGLLFDAEPWIGIRPCRMEWTQTAAVRQALAHLDAPASPDTPLPSKAFLSRKDARIPSNEAEIADWLGTQGFVTLYPEDLSAADQLRLFRQAETIVAVHGAGLAPLLYAPAQDRPRHLVEILPCGHMTDVYRVMAQQMGWNWIGVRGRMKPEYVRGAYDFSAPFTTHSLDTFEIDLTALQEAFRLAALS